MPQTVTPVRQALPRKLGVVDATALVIGIVIGSGIFVLPNVIARTLPSASAILTAWVISGVLSFIGALAYGELGAMIPATGGQYIYIREAYGPMWAFVCGWTFMLAITTGGVLISNAATSNPPGSSNTQTAQTESWQDRIWDFQRKLDNMISGYFNKPSHENGFTSSVNLQDEKNQYVVRLNLPQRDNAKTKIINR